MLISAAYATTDAGLAAAQPSGWEVFAWNMGLVMIILVLFYVLMVLPQQRRFKEYRSMVESLKKGDKVVTGGGLVGKVDKAPEGEDEIVVDLGSGLKVTALRSTITSKVDDKK